VFDGGVVFEFKWHDFHEGFFETLKLGNEVLLLLFDVLAFSLL
jgi:hypothetical protein